MKTRFITRAAFTMVEILIVIAIIGVMLTIGIPAIRQTIHKDSMRKAVGDVIEACQRARARAIVSGMPSELRFDTEGRRLYVAGGEAPTSTETSDETVKSKVPDSFDTTLSDELMIEMWSVNFAEMKDAPESAIRFYPNGTSDEFTVVLHSGANEWRQIKLDVITGLAEMKVIR